MQSASTSQHLNILRSPTYIWISSARVGSHNTRKWQIKPSLTGDDLYEDLGTITFTRAGWKWVAPVCVQLGRKVGGWSDSAVWQCQSAWLHVTSGGRQNKNWRVARIHSLTLSPSPSVAGYNNLLCIQHNTTGTGNIFNFDQDNLNSIFVRDLSHISRTIWTNVWIVTFQYSSCKEVLI